MLPPVREFFSIQTPSASKTGDCGQFKKKNKKQVDSWLSVCPIKCVQFEKLQFIYFFHLENCLISYRISSQMVKVNAKISLVLLVTPAICASSWAMGRTHATAVTQATAVIMLDP